SDRPADAGQLQRELLVVRQVDAVELQLDGSRGGRLESGGVGDADVGGLLQGHDGRGRAGVEEPRAFGRVAVAVADGDAGRVVAVVDGLVEVGRQPAADHRVVGEVGGRAGAGGAGEPAEIGELQLDAQVELVGGGRADVRDVGGVERGRLA